MQINAKIKLKKRSLINTMIVNKNTSFIYLSCNEDLYSPVRKYSGIDFLRNLGCSFRYICKDFWNKVSKVKEINMRKYVIVATSITRKSKNVSKLDCIKVSSEQNITNNYTIFNQHPGFTNFLKQFCIY